jgi:subtilase family serine protease
MQIQQVTRDPFLSNDPVPHVEAGASAQKAIFNLFSALLAIVTAGALSCFPSRACAGTQKLPGHVPAATQHAQAVGAMASEEVMNLAISLPLRHTNDLSHLIRDLYDPASPRFHQYLTASQFAEQFGPTPEDYQTVLAFAEANAFQIIGIYPNRTLLDVRGSVQSIERAFHVRMNRYLHPSEKRNFFSPDAEPSVELNVSLLHIAGLSDFIKPRPLISRFKRDGTRSNGSPLGTGSAGNGGFIGNDFRAAYAPNVTLTGAGQSVGLFELSAGFYQSDISKYESQAGLPDVPIATVLLDGFDGSPGPWYVNLEVAMDIETTISMAPGLDHVLVYEGVLADSILNRMATDNIAKQLSASWVYQIDAGSQQSFQQFAAQGQSFFNSSGDAGAYASTVSTPCDDPYITVVGGTVLTTTSAGGSWASETVWSGTGGGVSSTNAIPGWQQGVNMSTNGGSTTYRNLPDVALTADNIYVVAANGSTGTGDGTSASAPLWAGYMALINQLALAGGQQTIGFLNPAIYSIGTGTYQTYTNQFHDIVTGNNTNSRSPSEFYAVPGYDLCTGWGTPAGTPLINALAHPDVLEIFPTSGFNTAGGVGGPYTVNVQTLTLTNTGASTISWTSSSPASWLNISPPSGMILPGQHIAVTGSLTPAANSLALGSYTNTIVFTNQNDSAVFPRTFTVSVLAPPSIVMQPTNQSVLAQQTAAFQVSATGGQPMTYQWFFKGAPITEGGNGSGVKTSSLTITNASVSNAGSYFVVVGNAAQQVTSSNASLTVNPYIFIYQQPLSESLPVGSTAFFTAAAFGEEPLSYQWKLNGTNISGATGSSLSITNVQSPQTGTYTVAITNAYDGVLSAPAVVTATSASQLTATFDTLSPAYQPVPAGYAGLNWTNFYVDSGDPNVVVSSPNVASDNDSLQPAMISRSSPFDLISAYITAVFLTNQEVEARGYYQGMLLYDTTNALSDVTATNFQFNFFGVTRVDFISSINFNPGGYFGVDNMVVVEGIASGPTPSGSLQVFLKPITAIGNGALWQVDGGLPQSSGTIVSGLAAGNHTLSFLPASGWTVPVNQIVTVTQNQTNTTTGTYVLPNPPYFVSPSLGWSTNGFHGLVSNSSGIVAIVQSSSNLLSWDNVYTNSGSFLFIDSGASYINQRYYRLIIP